MKPRVLIVGGGLAGIACAAALDPRALDITLWEARSRLGGRAASYLDSKTGESLDHCQHVSMGCCTHLAELMQRWGCADCFRRDSRLTFVGPSGTRHTFAATPGLPAPLHLGLSLAGFSWLRAGDRLKIAWAMWCLARVGSQAAAAYPHPTAHWLKERGQSPAALQDFWNVVLVSALGDDCERVSLEAARKVFVEGFMAARTGYEVLVPRLPLEELFTRYGLPYLEERVRVETSISARRVLLNPQGLVTEVETASLPCPTDPGSSSAPESGFPCDYLVLAVGWKRAAQLLPAEVLKRFSPATDFTRLEPSPITGVHLWYDRPLTRLPHVTLVGRTSQWLFMPPNNPGQSAGAPETAEEHYHQVVISGSRNLQGREKGAILKLVDGELKQVFPEAQSAQLLRGKVITEHEAVFTIAPAAPRPPQATPCPNLFLCGDWTQTGWPATMEGAVISGRLAADALALAAGLPRNPPIPPLPWGPLAKWLIKK